MAKAVQSFSVMFVGKDSNIEVTSSYLISDGDLSKRANIKKLFATSLTIEDMLSELKDAIETKEGIS